MTHYDEIARGYNELHAEEQKQKLTIIKRHLTVRPETKILDVGCGTGLSKQLGRHIIGIDPSIKLLEQAEFPVVCGVAEHLPFKDQSFDTVISVTALHNFAHKSKGLDEIRRVGQNTFALTVMKKSSFRDEIDKMITSRFSVKKVIQEEKDVIYIAHKP